MTAPKKSAFWDDDEEPQAKAPSSAFWEDEEPEPIGPTADRCWAIVSDDGVHDSGLTYAEAEKLWHEQHKAGNTSARFRKESSSPTKQRKRPTLHEIVQEARE